MAAQLDSLEEKPELKAGYDNEYMRMFVKQFASNFMEIHDRRQAEHTDASGERNLPLFQSDNIAGEKVGEVLR
jgi:hypothetical protein